MSKIKKKRLPGNLRGPVSKQALYNAASSHAHDAIAVLVQLMKEGKHESTKMGAAKTLLAKCLPDLKSTELSSEDGKALVLQILGGNTKNALPSDNSDS